MNAGLFYCTTLSLCFSLMAMVASAQNPAAAKSKWKIPVITDEPERFDTTKFNTFGMQIVMRNDDSIYIWHSATAYIETLRKKIELLSFRRNYGYAMGTKGFEGTDYSYDTTRTFGVFKLFYDNGNLLAKGGISPLGFEFGKWYHYSADGKLSYMIDKDEDFKFGIEDLLKYCEENNIPVKASPSGPRTYINKVQLAGKKVWRLTYPTQDKKHQSNVYLSADDGTLLKTEEQLIPVGKTYIN